MFLLLMDYVYYGYSNDTKHRLTTSYATNAVRCNHRIMGTCPYRCMPNIFIVLLSLCLVVELGIQHSWYWCYLWCKLCHKLTICKNSGHALVCRDVPTQVHALACVGTVYGHVPVYRHVSVPEYQLFSLISFESRHQFLFTTVKS